MPDIIDTKFDKVKEKRYNFKDYILPGGGILLGLASIIFAYFTNQDNNDNAKQLKEYEVQSMERVKQFEITYLEKRKSYAELLNESEKVFELFNNMAPITDEDFSKCWNIIELQFKKVNYQCYLLHPFLDKNFRDTLDTKTLRFQGDTEDALRTLWGGQGNPNPVGNTIWSFRSYVFYQYQKFLIENLFYALFPEHNN